MVRTVKKVKEARKIRSPLTASTPFNRRPLSKNQSSTSKNRKSTSGNRTADSSQLNVSGAKKRKARPGRKALQEIKHYQKSYDLLIPKLPFSRLVNEITADIFGVSGIRYEVRAMEALQESTEHFVTLFLQDANLAAIHARRCTLMVKDIKFIQTLRNR